MHKSKETLETALASLGAWHHSIDLGFGIRTAPQHTTYDPVERWKVLAEELPEDLNGATVLDLGANSGYMSVQMKMRGAGRVVAVDVAPHYLMQARFLAEWFEVEIETVQSDVHLYCLSCAERFDYVLFMGLFYHLKYPVLVLDRAAEMATKKLFFQTVLFNSQEVSLEVQRDLVWADRTGLMSEPTFPSLRFIENQFESDWSNWWIANRSGVSALLRNAGLEFRFDRETGVFICTPHAVPGKIAFANGAVFPKYGKGPHIFPQQADACARQETDD
jgi:tRNA (mo5U34)-methyltransferase